MSRPSPPPRRIVTEQPLNAETPLEALIAPAVPVGTFYVRSNFAAPVLAADSWRLVVGGCVEHPLSLSLAELEALPAKTLTVTVECAGNGRTAMRPIPPGTPWDFGAVATAQFTGTPLRGVLERAGLTPDAVEVLFVAADAGTVETGAQARFERSLPVAEALNEDVLLVWAMNGQPLAPEHGAPLRLVVPSWYGMAWVKWLSEIQVLARPFEGFFQTERYIYVADDGTPDGTPVARMRVRALITEPTAGASLPAGPVSISGAAWSGSGAVVAVEISTDGGETWAAAELAPASEPYARQLFSYTWQAQSGDHHLVARATDAAGNVQPLTARSNELGYGNNGVHPVAVTVLP
jgi:DMSO/TMAO reductase YedYZ molybdopterin-dependent catalytic subunit